MLLVDKAMNNQKENRITDGVGFGMAVAGVVIAAAAVCMGFFAALDRQARPKMGNIQPIEVSTRASGNVDHAKVAPENQRKDSNAVICWDDVMKPGKK